MYMFIRFSIMGANDTTWLQSPEELANVVQQCKEYGKDAWPDKKGSEAEEEDWRNDWRNGMDGVEGL